MEEAKRLFEKLKIVSLLDLALILPSSYQNSCLSTLLQEGEVQTFEAVVEEVSGYRGKLRVRFHLSRFGVDLIGVFFHVTPYHRRSFVVGSRHYIQGRVERYRGTLQMAQPKSLKEVGKILPKYTTPLKNSTMKALIAHYVTEKQLYASGLTAPEVSLLMGLHFPRYEWQIKGVDQTLLKMIEAYNHLQKLKGKRVNFPALMGLHGRLDSFVRGLPFQLTADQERVIREIQSDLAREDQATKRLIIGDVGSGKTMVILASAVMAYPNRSILMAPTSLLAMQIYEEARAHLPQEVSVALVMQNSEQGDYHQANFVIGTHALLYKEDLPQAPLIMVDEQHRFGTKQRALLEQMMAGKERKPHFLQFSATPIPRTQAMMESALIDVSLITSTPFKKEISTRVVGKEDFQALLAHIHEEIHQHHQVLIVYPLVEESREIPYQSLEEGRAFWEKHFEGVYLTHGKDKHKEEVLMRFREEGSILLATTVVEVGISLPRLTLIVIVGAERLGLATLHQLRGRVGRLGLKSWCYLFTHQKHNKRLHAFTQTMSGFEIATLDLKFRNAGDILDGKIQSGLTFKWLDLAEDEEIVKRAKARLKMISEG